MFGYKNHIGIDREHGFARRFTVTHAAAHDGAQLGAVLDPANTASSVWADTAYRSAANIEFLGRRGLVPRFQRAKPRGRPRAAPHRPRQRPPRPHPIARQARLRRPEAPARPRHPHCRQGARHGEAGAGQSRLQLHPPRPWLQTRAPASQRRPWRSAEHQEGGRPRANTPRRCRTATWYVRQPAQAQI